MILFQEKIQALLNLLDRIDLSNDRSKYPVFSILRERRGTPVLQSHTLFFFNYRQTLLGLLRSSFWLHIPHPVRINYRYIGSMVVYAQTRSC